MLLAKFRDPSWGLTLPMFLLWLSSMGRSRKWEGEEISFKKDVTWKLYISLLPTYHWLEQIYTLLQGGLGNVVSTFETMCSTKIKGESSIPKGKKQRLDTGA